MKTQFNYENEAVEALDAARTEGLGWCHLIKEDCRVDCVSYRKGYIKQHAPKPDYPWNVYFPYCLNPLVLR